MNRKELFSLVREAIEELNQDWELPELEEVSEETRLFGAKSGLDSIALVSLISEVEDRVRDALDRDIVLADDRAMSMMRSPFRRVGTLVDHLEQLLDE